MVTTLGPGKFYGSALPRPRIYTDVKFSEDRVDPPLSVVDPLLSWAKDAHWSMGGLSFTRLRLQGRIEGKISKLRAQKEKEFVAKEKGRVDLKAESEEEEVSEEEERPTPVALVVQKRRRRLVEESEDEEGREEEFVGESKRKSLKRKLYDEFDAVAKKGDGSKVVAGAEKGKSGIGRSANEGRRTSPRTSKNGGIEAMVTPESAKAAKGEIEIGCSTAGRLRVSPRLAKLANGGSGSSRVSRRLVKSG